MRPWRKVAAIDANLTADCARLERDRLKTRDLNRNGLAGPARCSFFSALYTTSVARGHRALVIEVIADLVGMEYNGRNKLPPHVAEPITKCKFVSGIDAETVGERQRLTSFPNDPALVGAGD